MLSKVSTFVSGTGVKEIRAGNTAEKVNELDRAFLSDRKGNTVVIEAGIIYKCLITLSSVRNLTLEQYIAEFKKILEEDKDAKKPE